MTEPRARYTTVILTGWTALTLIAGLLALAVGRHPFAEWAWLAGTLPVIAALLLQIVTSLRKGEVGLDLIALLSMAAAIIFGETLAANVIALMYAGGQLISPVQGALVQEFINVGVILNALRPLARGRPHTPAADLSEART